MPLLPLPFNPSGAMRTRIGKAALAVGVATSTLLLCYGIWVAVVWRDNFGIVLLFSGLCYATAIYLFSRFTRRLVDRRRRNGPPPGQVERRVR